MKNITVFLINHMACNASFSLSSGHPQCGQPEQPIYGTVKIAGEFGHYSCIPGYTMRGNATRRCSWKGWEGQVPECTGMHAMVIYRVTHLLAKNLLMTWIWNVLPFCLGSRQSQLRPTCCQNCRNQVNGRFLPSRCVTL